MLHTMAYDSPCLAEICDYKTTTRRYAIVQVYSPEQLLTILYTIQRTPLQGIAVSEEWKPTTW